MAMAVDAVVHTVLCHLADYRQVLRESAECRSALMVLLDTFVVAGWPQAFRLTYRLGEIDR